MIVSAFSQEGKQLIKNSHIAFGVFDGLHLGHRRVVDSAIQMAQDAHGISLVLTFDIDPDELFNPEKNFKILSNEERLNSLESCGVDAVLYLPFNEEFASIKPEKFLWLLFGETKPASIHIGNDMRFGARAAGDVDFLAQWGQKNDVGIYAHRLLKDGSQKISSTYIRSLLAKGEIEKANGFLLHHYHFQGKVEKGKGKGKGLGFATANINSTSQPVLLKSAVYGGRAYIDGRWWRAAICMGKSDFYESDLNAEIEVHLIDYHGKLYGRELIVECWYFIRDMIDFPDEKTLIDTVLNNIDWVRNTMVIPEC